jgi:hypothetical protein
MEEIFGQAIPILQLVLPGFLATFIFYWLSDSPKPGQFERIVQALFGTVIIRFLVGSVESAAHWIGHYHSFGEWTAQSTDLVSAFLAATLGLGLAYVGNNDFLYAISRKLNFTFRSAYGSDWRFAHRTLQQRSVVLQFLDGRRLAGYPRAWPTDPEKGHYLMQFPTWIVDDEYQPATGVSFMLVSASDVQWTEFLDLVEEEENDVE